jgi:hypothetical protein
VDEDLAACRAICDRLISGQLDEKAAADHIDKLAALVCRDQAVLEAYAGTIAAVFARTKNARCRMEMADAIATSLGGYDLWIRPWGSSRFAADHPLLVMDLRKSLVGSFELQGDNLVVQERIIACLGREDWLRMLSCQEEARSALCPGMIAYAWQQYARYCVEAPGSIRNSLEGGCSIRDRDVYLLVLKATRESKDAYVLDTFLAKMQDVFRQDKARPFDETPAQVEFVAEIGKCLDAIATRTDLEAETRARAQALRGVLTAFRKRCDTSEERAREKKVLTDYLAKAESSPGTITSVHRAILERAMRRLDDDADTYYMDIVREYEREALYVDKKGVRFLEGEIEGG